MILNYEDEGIPVVPPRFHPLAPNDKPAPPENRAGEMLSPPELAARSGKKKVRVGGGDAYGPRRQSSSDLPFSNPGDLAGADQSLRQPLSLLAGPSHQ